ncbi:pseudouridine synthase [Lentinula aciculospora]|uniref:Pseudouridine synthase n=1 Tax=Lentinula aciculospora TaxID=153920 RepID=A0A9W9DIV7_9AGAR|nr:pseudouridine synthase [Lentinula aciculospora]
MPATGPGLKKIPPYWYPYTTYAKHRWLGRELLEVVSTEFRDRSMEYYRYALDSGVTTINGQVANPSHIIQNGDRMENVVHRHEPPVTSTPIRILLEDKEREFIVVDKPGSIPVHASGRYHRNTLVAILMSDFGYEKVYTVNRLDRLTSGLMILPTSSDCARKLTKEFVSGTVRKEYVARVNGRFPDGDVICEQPLLTVDRQMGLNIVHQEGRSAKTIFTLIRYDENTDTSVVHCKPMTGRSHQLRVHLQYLGHPISNDPVYGDRRIWGEKMGKGGIDTIPSDERTAPAPPPHLADNIQGNPESLARTFTQNESEDKDVVLTAPSKLLPRETGEDIGMGSPVPLSSEAVGVITRLRNMKVSVLLNQAGSGTNVNGYQDEAEDWSRWRDVIFRAKGTLRAPRDLALKKAPPGNKKQKNKGEFVNEHLNAAMKGIDIDGNPSITSAIRETKATTSADPPFGELTSEISTPLEGVEPNPVDTGFSATPYDENKHSPQLTVPFSKSKSKVLIPLVRIPDPAEPIQLTATEALSLAGEIIADSFDANAGPDQFAQGPAAELNEKQLYCPECYLPLHPDPVPEKLYIFLHALRYTTSLGTFETGMPAWSAEGFFWDRS